MVKQVWSFNAESLYGVVKLDGIKHIVSQVQLKFSLVFCVIMASTYAISCKECSSIKTLGQKLGSFIFMHGSFIFMNGNFIFMHENELIMHENELIIHNGHNNCVACRIRYFISEPEHMQPFLMATFS